MLATACKKPPETSLHKYLANPDVNDNQWKTRDKGETEVIFCNQEITLTEELKQYLLYFSFQHGKNCSHTIPSFSNIPLKQNVKVPGNLNT